MEKSIGGALKKRYRFIIIIIIGNRKQPSSHIIINHITSATTGVKCNIIIIIITYTKKKNDVKINLDDNNIGNDEEFKWSDLFENNNYGDPLKVSPHRNNVVDRLRSRAQSDAINRKHAIGHYKKYTSALVLRARHVSMASSIELALRLCGPNVISLK